MGYDVAAFVNALADAGYVAVAPIRPNEVSRFSEWQLIAQSGLEYLATQRGVDPSRRHVIGYSKGGLLTLQNVVGDDSKLASVVLMSAAPGQGEWGWAPYATVDKLQAIDVPVLATLGEAETGDIPANAQKLVNDLQALGKPAELKIFDDPHQPATHQWFHEIRPEYWPDILAWLEVH